MKIILVRHCETYGNIEGRFNGVTESPLTSRGILMEDHIVNILLDLNKSEHIDKIFTSPSKRVLHTAKKFSNKAQVNLEVINELIEYNFGIFDGLTFKEARKIDNNLLDSWLEDSINLSLPKGESFRDKTNRVNKWINELLQQAYNTVIIFTHGATFRSILMELLELPLQQAWHFNVGLGAFCIINYENNFGVLEKFVNPDYKF